MSLTELLAQRVREAGGETLILDARRGRALLTEAALARSICMNLRAAGFERFIDFSAQHLGDERFSMTLTLRCPAEQHSALVLKWTYNAAPAAAAAPPAEVSSDTTAEPHSGNGHLADEDSANGASATAPGAERPRSQTHPSLSRIWPAAGLAEREIFEMLGIVFSGSENMAPLLLDEQFQGFPLRRDFAQQERESFASRLLEARHNEAVREQLA